MWPKTANSLVSSNLFYYYISILLQTVKNLMQYNPIANCVYGVMGRADSGKVCFSDHYLAYAAHGSMRLEIESRYLFLQPTKAAWIPANVEVIADIRNAITCCSILYAPSNFPKHKQIVQTINLTPLAQQMILHCRRWADPESANTASASTFFLALANILVEGMNSPTTDWVPRGTSSLVSRAVDLTMERYMMPLEIGEIASSLSTSERTLSRRVVDETGMTWSNLLRRIRIIHAREKLTTTELQVTRVAADVGYSSHSAFNRAFKEETALTPSEFISTYKRDQNKNI